MANDYLDIRKALDLASTGQYLIPQLVEEAIRDYVSRAPVVYNAVTKVPWATPTYFIRKRTALPTASWSTDGAALPAVSNQQFAKVSKTVKYLYTQGSVTGPMQEAAGSLYNALAMEVETHSQAMVEQLSTDIITADGTANNIDGIIHQIDVDLLDMGSGATAGTDGGVLDGAAAALSLSLLDQAVDLTRGEADMALTSRRVRRKVNSLLQATQQFIDMREINAGFRVLSYDGIGFVTDLHWETAVDVLFIRQAQARLLVHRDITFEPLAKTKDSDDFMLKAYMGFSLEGRPSHLKNFTGA